jgi:hypothetical protein
MLRCGDTVADNDDPRHIGRVEAIRHGAFALVRWHDTGWTSELPVVRLRSLFVAPTMTFDGGVGS